MKPPAGSAHRPALARVLGGRADAFRDRRIGRGAGAHEGLVGVEIGGVHLREARLLLEPGRWLAGPAGVYLCRVTRTKERGGRVVAISDGGIHHLLRPRLVGGDHRVVPVGAMAARVNGAGCA